MASQSHKTPKDSNPVELTPLEPQAVRFRLLLICFGHCRLANSVSLYTNLKCGLAVQCPNHLAETTDNVIEGMNFVVVQDHSPHFLLVLFFFGLGFDAVHYFGSLFGSLNLFGRRHVQLGLFQAVRAAAFAGDSTSYTGGRKSRVRRKANGTPMGRLDRCQDGKSH